MTVGVVCASEDVNDTSATADADDSITQPIDDNDDSNASSDLLEASDEDELSDEGEFLDVSDAYDCLNRFRCEEGVWQWESDDATKTYFNTNDTVWLHPILRDAELEETAKIRAKELVQLFSHTRPDGTLCNSAFPEWVTYYGENIAWGYTSAESVTEGWKETDDPYDGQGHRRNMLDPDFNSVGIAAYKLNGYIYWVQDFATRHNPSSVEVNPFAVENNNSATPKFTIQLPIYATGHFAVKLNGTEIMRKSVFQGKAEIVIYGLNEGSYDVEMSYGGDNNYNPINATGRVYATGDDSPNVSFSYLNTLLKLSGNEVRLQKDYTFDESMDSEFMGGIILPESLTIDGHGHRIDAKGKARIFLAYKGVIVKNAELANAVADNYGGAVLSYHYINLENCTFTNNSAGKFGGAAYAVGQLRDVNSRFMDNNAGISGGALFGEALVSADGSTFLNNLAGNLGGAIYAQGTLHNVNTIYVNNTNLQRYSIRSIYGDGNTVDDEYSLVFANATLNNGVVNLNGDLTATQTILINASNVTINGNGYGIDASNRMRIFYITGDNVTIRNITLSGAMSIEGGAIFASSKNIFIIDSLIKNNRAETGAAVSTRGNVFITFSNFTDNVAEAGGAVFSDKGNVSVISSVFKNNDAMTHGGGAIYTTAGVYITDSVFTENDAVLYGGAIFTNGKQLGRVYINGSTFTNNTSNDGGVMLTAMGAEISNSTFSNNSAGNEGGIIATWSDVTVKSSNFTDNSAGGDGGVFRITKGNAMIEDSKFISNDAKGSGGVLKTTGNVTIVDSVFCDNSAQANGGAVMGSGYADVVDSEFINNHALNDAGAIRVSGNAYVSNSLFQNNKANKGSGAISSENIVGSNTNFTNNEGGNGKTFSGNVLLNNSKIIENDVDVTSSYIGSSDNQNGSGNSSGGSSGNVSGEGAGNSSGGSSSGSVADSSVNSNKIVKKATKITAAKKTFKVKAKTKKYTITLKSGTSPVKKVVVYLKIKGKTFKAKTNSKGKATFKISFKKKGTIKSKITFKGNKYYLKSSKTVKIKFK